MTLCLGLCIKEHSGGHFAWGRGHILTYLCEVIVFKTFGYQY